MFSTNTPALGQIPEEFQHFCGMSEVAESSKEDDTKQDPNYLPICTDPNVIRYVRVAIHYFLPQAPINRSFKRECYNDNLVHFYNYTGPGNFTEYSDGNGNTAYNGFMYANDVIAKANFELENNAGQWRKNPAITYPSTPPSIPMRLVLTGVYFHRDDIAYNSVGNTSQIHSTYDIESNQVIDIYIGWWPNADWGGAVFAINANNKYMYLNLYKWYIQPFCREWSKEVGGTTINHEIFHTFNIFHTWGENDLCNDTPLGFLFDKPTACFFENANCWAYEPSLSGCTVKPCDDWSKISNNIMDYNQYYPHATTTCQIDRVITCLNGNGNPYIHSCNGCMPCQAFMFMEDEIMLCMPNSVILNGQGSFNENQYLVEICEINPANPGNCTNGYYNSGWIDGKVGKLNLQSLYTFTPGKQYKVKLIVGNKECPGTDEKEKIIKIQACDALVGGGLDVFTNNPVTDGQIRMSYYLPADGTVSISLTNVATNQIHLLQNSSLEITGDYQKEFDIQGLQTGNYALQIIYQGQPFSKLIIKQ